MIFSYFKLTVESGDEGRGRFLPESIEQCVKLVVGVVALDNVETWEDGFGTRNVWMCIEFTTDG